MGNKRTAIIAIALYLMPCIVCGQSTADDWIARGMGYDSRNLFDSAAVCYRQVLAIDSLNVEAGWRLGAAYSKMDSVRQAIDQCMRVIEIDRKCKDVYYVIGSVFYAQGSYKSAEEYLRRATEFGGPGFVTAWCRLGESYLSLGDTSQAERCVQSVIENDESFQRAYFHMGEISRSQGKHAQAVEWYGQAVRKFPLYPEALFAMARSYVALANLKGAIDCLRKVVRMTPEDKEAHYLLGKCEFQNGESDKAARSLRRALAIDPAYAEAETLLSMIEG